MQEIIYTSAQSGLKPGSSGFCTVVCTAGMDQRTAQRLEGLSGYRHAFAVNDPRNPVNYQHITMRIGAASTHVLSRVCDAGPDHTGRTNKLAHHLAFTQPPSPSGPARLLDAEGVFVGKWDGQTSQRPLRSLPAAPLENTTLIAWASLTGDGGWAGHIAEQLIGTKQPVYILFAPGTDTLALLKEVIDLVPPNRRWGITFSTYYTNAIAGAQCQLRFVLDGTQDATKLRNDARAATVDLTADLPEATGGDLVDLARKGLTTYATPAAQKPAPQIEQALDLDDVVDDWEEPDLDDTSSANVANSVSPQPGTPPPKQAPNLFRANRRQKDRKLAAAGQRSGRGWIVGSVFGILLLIGGMGTGIWFLVLRGGTDIGGEQQVVESAKNAEKAVAAQESLNEETLTRETPEQPKVPAPPREPPSSDSVAIGNNDPGPPPTPTDDSPPVETLTDIFGSPLEKGAKRSDPVVRLIAWDESLGGVDIPVDPKAELHVLLHHHEVEFDVAVEQVGKRWSVKSGIVVTTKVGTITRSESNQLQFRKIGLDRQIPLTVCQLTSSNRCGFVIFQELERQSPIPLADLISDVTNSSARASQKVSINKLSEKLLRTGTQRIQIKDGKGRLLSASADGLDNPTLPSSVDFEVRTKLKPQSSDTQAVFHFVDGPKGCEHRHAISLEHSKRQLRLDYRLELAERGGMEDSAQIPSSDGTGIDSQWLNWMHADLKTILEAHQQRDWAQIRRDPETWCKEQSQILSRRITQSENALVELHRNEAEVWNSNAKKDEKARAQAFASQESVPEKITGLLGRLNRLRVESNDQLGSNNIKLVIDSLRQWKQLTTLADQIQRQSADAAASRAGLGKYFIHFSVYRPTLGAVKLPTSEKLYRLHIPVIEFSDRKSNERLNWKDLLIEIEAPTPNSKSHRQRVSGVHSSVMDDREERTIEIKSPK